MKNQFLQDNPEIAEYLMSMTGTIIYPKVGANGKLEPQKKAPVIIDSKTAGFHELLFGSGPESKVEVYKCDDRKQEGCKQMPVAKFQIAKEKALVPKITSTLESLGQKFKHDAQLSKAESDLVNAVDFPLSMILQSEIRAGWIPDYKSYAEIIARIVLSSYVHQILSQAQQAIVQNASASSDEDYKWIQKNLQNANRFIVSQYQNQAYKALQQRSDMVLRTIQVEHSVVGDMSALTQQKYSFGGL
jgi:conjugative transfer pilus assembly protein TraH